MQSQKNLTPSPGLGRALSAVTTLVQAVAILSFLRLGMGEHALEGVVKGGDPWTTTIVFLALLWAVGWVRSHRVSIGAVERMLLAILCALCSVVSVVGQTFPDARRNCLSLWMATPRSTLVALMALGGGFLLFWHALSVLGLAIAALASQDAPARALSGDGIIGRACTALTGRSRTRWQVLALLVVWGPQVLARYPGVMVIDSCYSLSQFLGMNPWTSKHPPLYALFVGALVKGGAALGNANWGLFALVVLQLLMALSMTVYTLHVLDELGVPAAFQALSFAVVALSPLVVAYVPVIVKDFEFAIAFVLLLDELALVLRRPDAWDARHIPLVLLLVIGLFFRRNGVYVLAAIIVLLVVRAALAMMRHRPNLRPFCLFLLTLVLSFGATRAGTRLLDRHLDVQQSYSRVIYSLPIQQVSRYMACYPNELGEGELDVMQEVMTLDPGDYADRYDPLSFDGVKASFDNDSTTAERMAYLRLWLSLLRRHPLVCLDATIIQNHHLVSPFVTDYRIYRQSKGVLVRSSQEYSYDLTRLIHDSRPLARARSLVTDAYAACRTAPIVGLTMQMGTYCVAFAYCVARSLRRGATDTLLVMVAPLLILGFIVVGPALSGHVRYAFPVMWSMPVWMGLSVLDARATPERSDV